MPTTVYTDGACVGNPGPGGWAWAVPGGRYASGADPQTTNQRMELTAALNALRAIGGAVVVVSDSRYVVDCYNKRWYDGWERRGWQNAKREPVANQDLWKQMVELFHARDGELTFQWVKGHAGDPMNDLVDRLAVEAAGTGEGRHGDEPPTDLGEADRPKGRQPAAAPQGHRIVVFGHRPAELGGYDDNPVAEKVRGRLTEILEGLRAVHQDVTVLTGLALGAEQLAARAAARAGVPYVAVLAFPDQEKVWPAARRAAYRDLIEAAARTVTLSAKEPGTRQEFGRAMGRRDDWLIDHADGALVIWDGKDRPLGDLTKALERRIPDDVWIVSPG